MIVASFIRIPFGGIETTRTWKVTMIDSLGFNVPRGMPRAGSTLLVGVPLIVTLFGMKVAPVGIGSVKTMSVSCTVCKFWNVTVYVIISPISTLLRSAVLLD